MLMRLRVGRQERKSSNRRPHKGDQYYWVLSELQDCQELALYFSLSWRGIAPAMFGTMSQEFIFISIRKILLEQLNKKNKDSFVFILTLDLNSLWHTVCNSLITGKWLPLISRLRTKHNVILEKRWESSRNNVFVLRIAPYEST